MALKSCSVLTTLGLWNSTNRQVSFFKKKKKKNFFEFYLLEYLEVMGFEIGCISVAVSYTRNNETIACNIVVCYKTKKKKKKKKKILLYATISH